MCSLAPFRVVDVHECVAQCVGALADQAAPLLRSCLPRFFADQDGSPQARLAVIAPSSRPQKNQHRAAPSRRPGASRLGLVAFQNPASWAISPLKVQMTLSLLTRKEPARHHASRPQRRPGEPALVLVCRAGPMRQGGGDTACYARAGERYHYLNSSSQNRSHLHAGGRERSPLQKATFRRGPKLAFQTPAHSAAVWSQNRRRQVFRPGYPLCCRR